MITRVAAAGLVLTILSAAAAAAERPAALSIHPDNPRYFLFRGKPLVLITATEHYGSVINRPFDFEQYLVDHAEKRQTFTRTFLLYRELQSAKNPWSPCKPESPDYIAPWPRVGPVGPGGAGAAADGQPKCDLDRWNPEFFDRLHRFLKRSGELGVVVELCFFSNSYNEKIWDLNPLNPRNNLQGVGPTHWTWYTTLKDEKLVQRQRAFVRKVVEETAPRYDHIYYEVCNEPGGDWPGETTVAEVEAWQAEIAKTIRDELKRHNAKHLVAGAPAHAIKPVVKQPYDDVMTDGVFDVVNFHSHPDNYLAGKRYDLAGFMTKDLFLGTLTDFCVGLRDASAKQPLPYVLDEDNAASAHKDEEAWTIERKRAWAVVMNQGHYDFIDFSITVGNETGTPESNRKIRSWMKNLSAFIHDFDFIHARPGSGWVTGLPAHVYRASLAVEGNDYVAYFADARERTDADAGGSIAGTISARLPDGKYVARFYSPVTGQYSPGIHLDGGNDVKLDIQPFFHDVVLRVTRDESR
jgi:hypothetical protein